VARASRVSFANHTLAVVRDAVATSIDSLDSSEWLATVTREVPGPFVTLVQQLAVAPIPEREEKIPAYCVRVASDLIDRDLLRSKADLLGALQRTDAAADPEKYASIQRDLVGLETERRALRRE
jgi:DNA primase